MPKRKNKLGLLLQFIISTGVLGLAIWSFFDSKILLYAQGLLALDMFIMAYNNQRMYERKNFTLIYIVVGVVIAVVLIIQLLGH